MNDPRGICPAVRSLGFEAGTILFRKILPDIATLMPVHEPVLRITPDLEIEPGLASYGMPDGTPWVLTLPDGSTFHHGTALGAKAVAVDSDLCGDVEIGSPRAGELRPSESVEVTRPLEATLKARDL